MRSLVFAKMRRFCEGVKRAFFHLVTTDFPPVFGNPEIATTVYIGFYDYGFSGQSGYSDRNPVDGPPSLLYSNLGYNGLQFRPLCSELATVDSFGGRYIQRSIVFIGFGDHLVGKPSESPLNLATTIGFSELDPCDRDWL